MKNLVLATIVLSFFSGPAIASKSQHAREKSKEALAALKEKGEV